MSADAKLMSTHCARHVHGTAQLLPLCHVGQTILCACMYMHAVLPMSAATTTNNRHSRHVNCVMHVSYTYFLETREMRLGWPGVPRVAQPRFVTFLSLSSSSVPSFHCA